ncbi:uncharacterized protein [Euwallacea similis]|uniref:uncharacterized protein n=1 Tax=Euwallacea similis TaxID=1736056 RepID=UPI00344E7F8B
MGHSMSVAYLHKKPSNFEVRSNKFPLLEIINKFSRIPCSYYYDHPTTCLSYDQTPILQLLRNHSTTTKSKSPLCQFRYANTFSAHTASTYPPNSISCGFGQGACEDYYQKYEGEGHTCKMHHNKWVLHQKHEDDEFGTIVNKEGCKERKNLVPAKMHKYVSKNSSANVKKKPSVLRLPVTTQPDPFLARKRDKTHEKFQHPKRIPPDAFYHQSSYNDESFSAHKINSEGDVKGEITIEDLDTFLDKFEKNMAFQDGQDVNIKEFAKFLKLKIKVPSSVKIRHQQLKSRALAPKMKMSLDKLMDRLRKCDDLENHSEEKEFYKSDNKKESSTSNPKNAKSFTYDSLARKYPPNPHKKEGYSASESRNHDFFNSPFVKKSARTIYNMVDQKELCYEIADSIIANTSIPLKEEYGPLVDRESDKEVQKKPCTFSEDQLTRNKSKTNQHPNSKPSQALSDNFENNIASQDDQDVNIEEIPKSWDLKAPSLMQMGQEQVESRELTPKINMSMDKLLDPLQNCDNLVNHSEEEESRKSGSKKESSTSNSKDAESFNDNSLPPKYSLLQQREEKHSALASESKNHDSYNGLFAKRSKKIIRAMDDYCALDLHKSKSYIVDLIDRALSKELGTVPRDESLRHDMSPIKAITTIELHQRTNEKELCYEVTAQLTDSIIANATASHNQKYGSLVEQESDNKIRKQPSEEICLKQLKQLRWDHILHIQHEAKELAKLEEFLEKYSETHQ